MSGQILHLEPDPHVAVQRLLPWYLTGRLDTDEHDAVETHLAQCPECRAELETERQWQLLQPGRGAQVDVEDGWARMRARLAGSLFNTNGCEGAHSYYFDHHGDLPYLRPTTAAAAFRAARGFPLDDYRYTTHPCTPTSTAAQPGGSP